MGRDGPAFLAYPNFEVYFEWNKSFVYVTTAAYFATRLSGAPVYDAGNPTPSLSGSYRQIHPKPTSARPSVSIPLEATQIRANSGS